MESRFYPSDGNVNFHKLGTVSGLYGDNDTELSSKSIKKITKLITNGWLFSRLYEVLYWFIVDPQTKKVRLIKSKKEYKEQKRNIYTNYEEKRKHLKEGILSKKRIVRFLKKLDVPYDKQERDQFIISTLRKKLLHHLRRKVKSLKD